jgi:surface antigen
MMPTSTTTSTTAEPTSRPRRFRRLAACAVAGLVTVGALGATAGVASAQNGIDDLPAAGSGYPGFEVHSCVDFVAWRLKQAGVAPANLGSYGNAANWDDMAKANGIRVDTTPAVGAVAQWNENEASPPVTIGNATYYQWAGSAGHVAYVTGVLSNGNVTIDEYNQNGDHAFHKSGMNGQAPEARAPRYIHFEDVKKPALVRRPGGSSTIPTFRFPPRN